MIQLKYDKKFLKEVQKLPVKTQKKVAEQLEILGSQPFDSRLHSKALHPPLQGLFSVRVTREYRILFRFIDEETIFLIHVRHRKDIYRK